MGLAPYGEYDESVATVFDRYCSSGNGDYDIEPFTYRSYDDCIRKLERDLGFERRYWRDEITQEYKDVAYHAQSLLEDVVTDLVSHHVDACDLSKVCLAGGVALNCKMNKRVRELPRVEELFVQPVAHDGGGSLGASLELCQRQGFDADEMTHVYFGTEYGPDEIVDTLNEMKISYSRPDDVVEHTAEALAKGHLIAWYQGAMEAGPRALGNRSILADPREEQSLDNVNRFVKHREEWRPFAPSMLPSDAERYLVGAPSNAARFMVDTHEVTDVARKEIPAVLHPSDKTTRPQIVFEETNPRYHRLLESFKEATGVGVVLNTSFNDSGEPIVRTPREAVRDFYSMGLDQLVLGDFVLRKDDVETTAQL